MSTHPGFTNFYAGNDFQRCAERRTDSEWFAKLVDDQSLVMLPLWNGKSLVAGSQDAPRLPWVTQQQVALACAAHELVFLGEFRSRYCVALAVDDTTRSAFAPFGEFHDLRLVGGQMNRHEAGLLGYARALLLWHERHRYCGRCGASTLPTQLGHTLKCTNASCGISHFPRLDPAIIVLVTDGQRVLLGRQAHWPARRYSTIAGFIEWAESIEEAVVREVREETGVLVDRVEYHSSQPWPFPSSLMLGFIAHAATADIVRHDAELEDARWFTRDDLRQGVVTLPPPQSVSYRLIETWFDAGSEVPLAALTEVARAQFTQPNRG